MISAFLFYFFLLGPPLRLRLAALCFAARKSARPCGSKAAWVWPFGPLLHSARPTKTAALPQSSKAPLGLGPFSQLAEGSPHIFWGFCLKAQAFARARICNLQLVGMQGHSF